MRGKIWGVIAAAFAAVCMFGTQHVYANETQSVVHSENNFFDNEEDAIEYFNLCIMEQDESIVIILSDDMCKDIPPRDKFSQLLEQVAMYYETAGLSYSSSKVSGGTEFTIYPQYKVTVEQNNVLNQTISSALKSLELDGKNEYQKVRAIHDYICDNVDYDFTYSKYTAYDALIGGKAVCQGFANLFFRMCYEAELEAELITGIGNGGGHAWNIIKIGDVYYNIDVTWDGQDTDTRHTYFLKSEKEFGDHYRNDYYDTEEYHENHPMANDSWMDFTDVLETESVDNIGQVYFNKIDGGTVSNRAENNRPKILIFGSTKSCTNTSDTVSEISGSDFKDVDVVVIDANMATLATVQNFKTSYGNGNDSITYSYNEGYDNLSVMWDYVEAVGIDMKYFPLIVFIDSDNKIQYSDYSSPLSAVYVRNIVNTYLFHNPLSSISAITDTVDVRDSIRLYVDVYGTTRNAQFFTWSSSDPSVAAVDENGVIKGLKEGTANITCKINDSISHMCTVTVKMPDGLNMGADGKWAYYKNGVVDTSYTGMAEKEDGWWYVKNGYFDETYTGMLKKSDGWWYVKAGKIDTTYTGMAKKSDGWWYVKAGKIDETYTGMAKNAYGWWYMKNGKLDRTYTGMAKNAYGWWYMKNGQLDKTYTGMAKNAYGWWYMKNGKLDRTYTGMAKNAYGWWYMKNGQLDKTYTGMAKNAYGWWYMKNGQLDRTYTGMAKNAYGWWYLENGTINFKYVGLASNDYGTWYINKGKLDTSYNGEITFKGKTYTIKNGKVI